MPERNTDRAQRLAGLASLLLLAACGARSSLRVCREPGETRACENACGVGSQTCTDDRWGECVVAVASRNCSNDCGHGTQTCTAGAWSTCEVPQAARGCSSPCGQGHQQCVDGGWQACDAPQRGPPTLTATIRDFDDTDPDFEPDAGAGLDPGIVAMDLGPDDKPVYAGGASTASTHGAAYFGEWYRDVPCEAGTMCASVLCPASAACNMATSLSLAFAPLPQDPGVYAYDNDAFFPIDNRLFGNQNRIHNYDFTLEIATRFHYTGGETFRFRSDDDSWVFLNRKLAVDLGGVHQAASGSIDLDLESQKLGIVKGGTYPMNLFYAERHVVGAVLHIDLTAADVAVCP
jgi:fibro-slime domain-containing protein